jgi:hypothetical protein
MRFADVAGQAKIRSVNAVIPADPSSKQSARLMRSDDEGNFAKAP